jgi:hypothetical protein
MIPVVPPKSNRLDPWEYDRELYKKRNEVERSRPGNYMVGSCGPQRIGYLACLAA